MDRANQNSTNHIEAATVSVTVAAKRLGIGRQTAYMLAREGTLPGVIRLGRRFVVSRSQLDAVLNGQLKEFK